jgi:hypothetical protein
LILLLYGILNLMLRDAHRDGMIEIDPAILDEALRCDYALSASAAILLRFRDFSAGWRKDLSSRN